MTLVGNDTGGAICQSVVAAYPERVDRLVLTNCDAFENFLPPVLRYVQWGAHVPGFVLLMSVVLRARALWRLPITFGWLTKRPIEDRVIDSYPAPMQKDAGVRRDLGKLLRDISPGHTLAVADKLPGFRGRCRWRGRPRTSCSPRSTPGSWQSASPTPPCVRCPTPGRSSQKTRRSGSREIEAVLLPGGEGSTPDADGAS